MKIWDSSHGFILKRADETSVITDQVNVVEMQSRTFVAGDLLSSLRLLDVMIVQLADFLNYNNVTRFTSLFKAVIGLCSIID